MSHIDSLIKRLCPEGVAFKSLGDLEDLGAVKLGRGNVISKTDLQLSPGEYPVYSSSAVGVGEFGRYGKFMFEDERITWSVDGGGKFFYRPAHKYSVTNVCGWLSVKNPEIIQTKFLYYSLINSWSKKTYNYTVKAHPSVIRVDYILAIPPLEVQQEIVRILETFTEYEAELEAELEARRIQFKHYLEKIILDNGTLRWVELQTVCREIGAGGDLPPSTSKGQLTANEEFPYPIFSNGTGTSALYGHASTYKVDEAAVTISARGTIGYHAVRAPNFTPIVRLITLIPDPLITTPQYLNFALYLATIEHSGGSIPQLTAPAVRKLKVPMLASVEQVHAVEDLNTFQDLIDQGHGSISTEIEARRKQYEHYRDRLLTFKELAG